MAQKTIVTMTDDLDGGRADQTVRFGLDGASYEIDLSKKHAAAMAKTLAPYITAARRIRTPRRPAASTRTTRSSDVSTIREWARQNGYDVSGRGRIPAAVLIAYRESA
jgi:hypothetical protein